MQTGTEKAQAHLYALNQDSKITTQRVLSLDCLASCRSVACRSLGRRVQVISENSISPKKAGAEQGVQSETLGGQFVHIYSFLQNAISGIPTDPVMVSLCWEMVCEDATKIREAWAGSQTRNHMPA